MKWNNTFLKNGLSGALLLLCAACFDKQDFDFDKLRFDDLNPTFHLPLLSDTLFVTDALKGDNIQFIDGQACFVYDVADVATPDASSLFVMPAQRLSFELAIPVGSGTTTGGGFQVPAFERSGFEVNTLAFDSDAEPASITFAGGSLKLTTTTFAGGGTLTLTMPALTKANIPLTATLNVGTGAPKTISLEDYTLAVPPDKKVEVEYVYKTSGFTVPSTISDIELDLLAEVTALTISRAQGYLGKHTEYASFDVTIGDFDKLSGDWALKEAFIALDVENSLVLPMRAVIDTIRSYTWLDAPPAVVRRKVDSIDVKAPTVLGATEHTAATLTIPGDVVNVLPKKLEAVLRFVTNPEGRREPPNIISSDSEIAASTKIIVPLKIKDINLTLTDTSNFDVSDVSFQNLGLLFNIQNRLPIGVALQCRLLHKDTGEDLGELFESPVRIPAGNTSPVGDDESEVTSPATYRQFVAVASGMEERLKQTGRIVVQFTVFSQAERYVRITDKDNVQLKIGVSASINVEDIRK
ncbi:MAG: hypothetical protein LBF90_06145 [Prevotellaceae bacterium]|jgi:hypothetical protein|nr:hypothetical protein [Prevotellaceae bacterium]